MSPEWIALITVIVIQFAALVKYWMELHYQREIIREQAENLKKQGKDLSKLEHHMNSMRENLVDAADAAGQHKGAKDERAREAAREKEDRDESSGS